MYPSDEQIPGLDVLTTLAQNDTHVVGDTSDATRSAKAITEANLEITIADSTNFQTELIAQNSFTTALANNTNFVTTLGNNSTFINTLTNNALFQTNVTTFIGGVGGGSGGTKLTIDTTDVVLTGDTAEHTMYSLPIPANTLGINNAIRFKFTAFLTHDGSGVSQFKVKYGATTLATIPMAVSDGASQDIYGLIIANAATNSQKIVIEGNPDAGTPVFYSTSAEDSTLVKNLVVTFQAGNNTNNITAKAIVVEKISEGSGVISTYSTSPVDKYVAGVGNTNVDDNTEMQLGMINIPQEISVSNVSIFVQTHNVSGTLSLVLYSEDGQTLLFNETTASIGSTGTKTTVITPITIPAGNYYLGVHTNGATDLQIRNVLLGTSSLQPTGKAVLAGTVTITASTTPATINPAVDISFLVSAIPLMRFDS